MPMTLRCAAVVMLAFAMQSGAQQPTPQAGVSQPSNVPATRATPLLIPRSEEERNRARRESHEIVLNVLVTDATGRPMRGLGENKFTILDGGTAQPITFFRPAQPPHVVLLLDAVNSSHWSYSAECKATEQYLNKAGAPLRFAMAIGSLSSSGISVNPESRDPKTLLGQVRAAERMPLWKDSEQQNSQSEAVLMEGGGTINPADVRIKKTDMGSGDKNRRFVLSVDALTRFALKEQNAPGRIVVLWLGAGWPLLIGPEFLHDSADKQNRFFDRIADLENDLRDAQVTLEAVATPELLRESGLSKGYFAPFLAAVTGPSAASAANLALPVVAIHSGGQVFDQDKNMAAAIAESLAGINSGYMLVFQSRPSSEPDEYRPLQVAVNVPGASVRTTTGYYAQP